MTTLTTQVSDALLDTQPIPVRKASLNSRAIALFIDNTILGVASGLILATITQTAPSWWGIVANILNVVVVAVYFIWPYSTNGQTIGKRLTGIKVVAVDGTPLTWRKGILRTIGFVASSLLTGLGFLWALWDKDRQTWHDKVGGTYVVPASIAPERLRGTITPQRARQRQKRWILGLSLPFMGCLATYALLLFMLVGPFYFPTIWSPLSGMLGLDQRGQLYDEDYMNLMAALSARWDPDDSIPSASMGFDTSTSAGETEVWLAIEISYTGNCTSTLNNSCEQLADELTRIVFDNYPKVENLDGIHIVIGDEPRYLNVEPSDIIFEKALTIQQWRDELSIGEE